MSAEFLDAIDWRRPWLAPFRVIAEPLLQAQDWRATLNAMASVKGVRNHRGLPIHFVPQASLPPQTPYEAFISATGGVPTRENLHDFFNALVWLSFPKIKIRLNALQAAEIGKASANPQSGRRGTVRDAATIFDENAALLVVRDPEWIGELRAHRWRELFITHRAAFERDCEVWLFGHALMEKLVAPYKAITAHVWPVVAEMTFFAMSETDKRGWLDDAVSTQVAEGLSTSDFTPLPVLGVPGWWEGQDENFYADATVFRVTRQRR